jgi:hypothetical protein
LVKRKDVAYDVRPLSFTEVLDQAFTVLRDRFWLLFGISAVAWIPYGVLSAAQSNHHAINLIALLVLMLLNPVAHAAITVAVTCVYLGTPATIKGSYLAIREIIESILGTYLLMYLLAAVLLLLLIIPGVYFLNCWIFLAPVMIVEQSFGMAALRRSRALVAGAWWRTFGLMIVVDIIVMLPASALQAFWAFIPLFGPILNAATQAITDSYRLSAIVIYYFDRRCRTEDFDLRLLAQQIKAEGAPAVAGTSIA